MLVFERDLRVCFDLIAASFIRLKERSLGKINDSFSGGEHLLIGFSFNYNVQVYDELHHILFL